MKIKIEYVNDDWVRMYIDGILMTEGHSIPPHSFYDALNVFLPELEYETTHVKEED